MVMVSAQKPKWVRITDLPYLESWKIELDDGKGGIQLDRAKFQDGSKPEWSATMFLYGHFFRPRFDNGLSVREAKRQAMEVYTRRANRMKSRRTRDPEIFCTSCSNSFSIEDSFDYDVGSEATCPECKTVMKCVETEPIRHWVWHATDKKDEDEHEKG